MFSTHRLLVALAGALMLNLLSSGAAAQVAIGQLPSGSYDYSGHVIQGSSVTLYNGIAISTGGQALMHTKNPPLWGVDKFEWDANHKKYKITDLATGTCVGYYKYKRRLPGGGLEFDQLDCSCTTTIGSVTFTPTP